jgi:hypothetical protein
MTSAMPWRRRATRPRSAALSSRASRA